MNTVRLFWAIRPPEPELHDARRVLRSLAEPCQRAGLKVSWVEPSSLHVTLKYLGAVAAERVDELVQAVRQALGARSGQRCPELQLGGLGAFPSQQQPAVLFVAVSDGTAPRLHELQDAVEAAMAGCGFEKEARPFHPHLTLGRVRDRRRGARPEGADGLAELFARRQGQRCGGPFRVTELTLYESRPTAAGVQYVPLVGVSVDDPSAPAQPLS